MLRRSSELSESRSQTLLTLQDDPEGVLVCLQCFNGGCFGEGRRHAFLHYEKTGHALGVVIKRTRKEPTKRVRGPPLSLAQAHTQDSSEPPLKKLAITAPSDDELYSYSTSLRCFACSTPGEAIHSEDQRVGSLSSLWRKVAHHRSLLSLKVS